MESEQQSVQTIEQPRPVKKKSGMRIFVTLLFILLVLGGAAAYWQRDKEAKVQQQKQTEEITALKRAVSNLTEELTNEKAKDSEEATSTKPSAATLENIKAAIKSGNTVALSGYMATPVKVIIAASDGVGDRSPAQAVDDITSYISEATDPWNFALPAATMTDYKTGDYAQYFPEDAVVGKSANNYVISFLFNNAGKIKTVFMAVNSDLL